MKTDDDVVIIRYPAEPVPFSRAGSHGKRRFTPTKQASFMGQVRLFAQYAMKGRAPLEGPVEMLAQFIYVVPASWSAKKRSDTIWKSSKPDADNLVKIVKDAIDGVVYLDDSQVASLTVQKKYGPSPLVVVTVKSI